MAISAAIAQADKQTPLVSEESVWRDRIARTLTPLKSPPRLIDLFCGAGGLTIGFTEFRDHFFEPVWANDFNTFAAETYNENFGDHCVPGDLVDILQDPNLLIPKADVVIGGPPCQGFSLLNKQRDEDPRKHLWRPYMQVVREARASIFLMENVPQLLRSREHERIVQSAEEMGFQTCSAILCAADYGVAQTRWRAFILGCSFTDPADFFPPLKTHKMSGSQRRMFKEEFNEYVDDCGEWRTLKDTIHDLRRPVGTQIRDVDPPRDLHFGRNPTKMSQERYRAIPKQGMNRVDLQRERPDLTPDCWIDKKGGTDLFGRLWWGSQALPSAPSSSNLRKVDTCTPPSTARSLIARRQGFNRSRTSSDSRALRSRSPNRSVTLFLPCLLHVSPIASTRYSGHAASPLTDVFNKKKRSEIMSKVSGKDTKPELLVRSTIHRMGYRFRLHVSDLPGKPDIVLPRYKKVVFVNGCFWHQHPGCRRATVPKSNRKFWRQKLARNVERDAEKEAELKKLGWGVMAVWECETRDLDVLGCQIETFLEKKKE